MTEDLLRDLVEYETYVQGQSRDDELLFLLQPREILSISINLMQVKGVIEEENNLFVLLHDNEVWVKATAGNVVKELFAKGAYEFGDIVNVIWSSS